MTIDPIVVQNMKIEPLVVISHFYLHESDLKTFEQARYKRRRRPEQNEMRDTPGKCQAASVNFWN